ncbi:DUF2809 domain-containing protein [Microbacterium halotolerans]|uniref:ribosomal maturation YjgA family protein n=1 Tax=Microbacterium halotolerans TaxID=246613 RepID=UPI000E6ADEEA|nr:DUF2809 domain-containing protein [Microbacterium halotolerans]
MRRFLLALVAFCVIAAGLAVHALAPDGFVGDAAGDALYAVLIYLLVAFVFPRWPVWASGGVALAWCTAIEFFQLTGLPELWGMAFRPLMLVFGTVFSWWDIVMYSAGVAIAVVVDSIIRMAGRARRRSAERIASRADR